MSMKKMINFNSSYRFQWSFSASHTNACVLFSFSLLSSLFLLLLFSAWSVSSLFLFLASSSFVFFILSFRIPVWSFHIVFPSDWPNHQIIFLIPFFFLSEQLSLYIYFFEDRWLVMQMDYVYLCTCLTLGTRWHLARYVDHSKSLWPPVHTCLALSFLPGVLKNLVFNDVIIAIHT